ncbi:MAG: TIGR03089 family protein [Marmoricola sp.]
MSTPRTFPELIAHRLRADAGQPLVTAYDDSTGERTELSVTTYANWVSKTANLFTDELGLDAGDTVLLDLPAHWLVPVFLGAAWSAGLAVTDLPQVRHAVAVCGPDTVTSHQDAEHVVACSLLPFAVRFPDPLPDGVLDYGLLWPGQSDVFMGLTLPSPDTVAWLSAERPRTHSDLLEAAAVAHVPDGVRLLTDVHPATDAGVPAFLAAVAHNGSVVLLRNAAEDSWAARRVDERTTAELRASA